MKYLRQLRMLLWGLSFRNKIVILHRYLEDPNEDVRTMAFMLLSILQNAMEKEEWTDQET